jgi:glucosamine--fructose-6-phosphate aminotransferase (isomerizing)
MSRSIADFRLYKAIRSQPVELDRLLSAPEPVDDAAALIEGARRVFTVGIGTSSNAAQAAAAMLRAAGLDASAWSSFDFVLYPPAIGPNDAAIVYTHSGRKRYSKQALEVLRDRGTPAVLVTGTESELTPDDYAGGTVVLRTVPREISPMFTVSHTAAMLLSARVADSVRSGAVGDLTTVPPAVDDALGLEQATGALAREWADRASLVAIGGGPHAVSAHEVAIKIAEAARRRIRSHATEQFLHGLQVQVRDDEAFITFAGGDESAGLERTREAARLVLDLGCPVAWVAPAEGPEGATQLRVADVGELLAPLVEAVPAQLLAGHMAAVAGVDGDSFGLDDPRFKAAQGRVQL